MSYAILRVSKLKASGLNASSRHNERRNQNYGNPNIDKSKIEENIHLVKPIENTYWKEMQRILLKNQVDTKLRLNGTKKTNVACELLFTSDKQFFDNFTKEKIVDFFKDVMEFVNKKVGQENIVSSVIHLDEKTPHLHVVYLPIVSRNIDGEIEKKLSCSEFWKGYNSYGKLQDEYYQFITQEKNYNLERGEKRELTGRTHIETNQYKIETSKKELKRLSNKGKKMQEALKELEQDIKIKEKIIQKINKIDQISPIELSDGKIANLSIKDVDILKDIANQYFILNAKYEKLSVKYVELKSKSIDPKTLEVMERELKGLRKQQEQLKKVEEFLEKNNISIPKEKEKKNNIKL